MLSARLRALVSSGSSFAFITSVALLFGCGPEQRSMTGSAPTPVDSVPAESKAVPRIGASGTNLASIERSIAAGARRFRKSERGFAAVNDAQRLEARLDARGARFHANASANDEDAIGLRLVAWGRGKSIAASETEPALGACA